MRKIENELVPLPDADTGNIRFDLNFPPFVDPSKIGVHVRHLELMRKIGGIEHLRIVGETLGKSTSQEINIVGFTNQGEAFAGKGKTAHVPTMQLDSRLAARANSILFSHCAEWVNVTATLNMDEIASRIMQGNTSSEGIRSINAWAKYLDRDIKKAVRKKGTRHLLFGLSKPQLAAVAIMDVPWLRIGTIDSPWDFVRGFLIGNLAGVWFGHFSARVRGENPRLSLFFGPELDRAAILQIMCRTKTLVKQI